MLEKLTLQNVPAASLERSMRDFFLDLVDISPDENGRGCLKSVPTNFGYVFFWYGWLNQKALYRHVQEYLPKETMRKIRQNKKANSTLKLQTQVSDFLFPIVRDHPEVIGEGHAEVHLSLVAPKLKGASVAEVTKSLTAYTLRLEKLDAFTRRNLKRKTGRVVEEIESTFDTMDFITEKEVSKFGDEYFWDDECGYIELAHRRLGCEVQVRIHFGGNEKLGEVVERIEDAITPLKAELDPTFRFGKSRWPF